MDKYVVKLMSRALRDLDGIYDYIAHALSEPETALNLVGRIEDAILSLESFPYRCAERNRGFTQTGDTGNFLWKTIQSFSGLMKHGKPWSL